MDLADLIKKELTTKKKCSIFDNLSESDEKYIKILEEKFYGVLAEKNLITDGMSEDELLILARYSKDKDIYLEMCLSNDCPETPINLLYERSKRTDTDPLSTTNFSYVKNNKSSEDDKETITYTDYEILEYIALNPNTNLSIINEIALSEYHDGDFSLNLKAAKNPKCKIYTLSVLRDDIKESIDTNESSTTLKQQLLKVYSIIEKRGHDKNIQPAPIHPNQLELPFLYTS